MKPNFSKIFVIGVIVICFSVLALAQQGNRQSPVSNLYVISAKAGAVNYVSGDVSIQQKAAKKGFLQKGDEVEAGDLVATGANGKTEVLLNPGSYIRLAENSEFEFVTTSLEDDLQIKLNRGSAIFEVIADKEFKVIVNTPKSRFYLIQSGVYRIDALENGGKISVWKGKAQVGDAKATTVKGGKSATFENMQVAIAKFDKKNQSEFELWSKDRAEQIAKINEKLIQRQMRQSLMNSFNNNIWSASNGYGLWVRDPFSQSFCFLPFGWGWRSPYGFGYNQSIWNYNPPPQITNTVYQNPNLNNPNNPQPPMNPPSNGGGVFNGGNSGGGNSGGGFNPPGQPREKETREQGERPIKQDRPDIQRPIDN